MKIIRQIFLFVGFFYYISTINYNKMVKTIKFQGLKFTNSFNFKNAKARAKYFKYFNDLLINNIDRFREKQKEYFTEKLHVLFTYMMLFKIFAYIDLVLALLFPGVRLVLAILAIMAIIMFIIHLILNKKFKKNLFTYEFTITMHENDEFIEFLREETLKDYNK